MSCALFLSQTAPKYTSYTRYLNCFLILPKIFTKSSPLNHRPNVDDVIVLITDGEPWGKRNTPQLTQQYAQDLKYRKVLLITAGIGPQSDRKQVKLLLEVLATSSEHFLKAKFDEMYKIDLFGVLVAQSCLVSGKRMSFTLHIFQTDF